jgi:hypothetical protein
MAEFIETAGCAAETEEIFHYMEYLFVGPYVSRIKPQIVTATTKKILKLVKAFANDAIFDSITAQCHRLPPA